MGQNQQQDLTENLHRMNRNVFLGIDPTKLPIVRLRGAGYANLDLWLKSRLPIRHLRGFLGECLKLDANRFRRPEDSFVEVAFVHGLQSAYYGDNKELSCFLDTDWFVNLTPPKREVLATIFQNRPQSTYPKRMKKQMLLDGLASDIALLEVWCGYSKTQAVKVAIENHLKGGLAARGEPIHDEESDQYLSKLDSLKTQVIRAIGENGECYDLYRAVLVNARFSFIFG